MRERNDPAKNASGNIGYQDLAEGGYRLRAACSRHARKRFDGLRYFRSHYMPRYAARGRTAVDYGNLQVVSVEKFLQAKKFFEKDRNPHSQLLGEGVADEEHASDGGVMTASPDIVKAKSRESPDELVRGSHVSQCA